jgi:uncharacterized protein (TIGR02300 family)
MAIAALALAPATRRLRLAKPEWGTKRICQSCGARFYDFGRSPITCPACGAVFDLEILNRARRARPGARAAVAAVEGITAAEAELGPEVEADEVEEEVEAEEDEAVVEPDDEAEEDDSLIEDASELGDDEDMSDVIEGGIDEEPR